MSAIESAVLTPEQELKVLKLILSLRQLGDMESSEKMRSRVRKILLEYSNADVASAKVDDVLRHYNRIQSKLDGTYDAERERKRVRREKAVAAASRYVEAEAESGDEDDIEEEGEDDIDRNEKDKNEFDRNVIIKKSSATKTNVSNIEERENNSVI